MTTDTSTIQAGDRTFRFKRMNIATFKKHLEFIKSAGKIADDQAAGKPIDYALALNGVVAMTEIVFECVKRADPTVTLEMIEEHFDQESIGRAFQAVMSGSGFVPQGEGQPGAGA